MRADLIRGCKLASKGTQPQLVCLLETPSADPEFYALHQTARQFRRHALPDVQASVLELLTGSDLGLRAPGPCGVLVQWLLDIGWMHLRGTTFRTRTGLECDLLNSALEEVRLWLEHGFSLTV